MESIDDAIALLPTDVSWAIVHLAAGPAKILIWRSGAEGGDIRVEHTDGDVPATVRDAVLRLATQ